ncbi:MAG: OmpA family protein [Gammaproteobacteria bacterium]
MPVDGPVTGEHFDSLPDAQRRSDVALGQADIRIKFDPLQVKPALNAWAWPATAVRGQPAEFLAYTNYAWFVAKAEIRLFERDEGRAQAPLAVLPLDVRTGGVQWTVPGDAPDTLRFVLRVYDARGRYDETVVKPLSLVDRARPAPDAEDPARERLVGWGENSLAVSNIAVRGGTVTVDGEHVPAGAPVTALDLPVPVDRNGRFALRQILPPGSHEVAVAVGREDGSVARYARDLSIADDTWFYVAMADLTLGNNSTTGPIEIVTSDLDQYDGSSFAYGRTAFYVKGKIKGKYLLTASADTREQPLEHLFSNFSDKDPRYLLRRIDPDRYYPVYGDDSTTVDDAPTQGKFYIRLDRGDSHVMWGNFRTQWGGSELLQYARSLYGANALYKSEKTTSFGERSVELNAFGAEPGTAQSREDFRGTGGSLYYLRHRDITQGSERVWIEERDRDSGLVLQRRELLPAQDYDMNYLQGRVMLQRPLPSTADGNTLVQTSALNGNPLFLVVNYEYVPGLTALDDLAYGVHAHDWVNDHLGVGFAGYRQELGDEKQLLGSVDVTLRYKPGTYVRAEVAKSNGAGQDELSSLSGGFDFAAQRSTGRNADAQRIDALVDFSEIWDAQRGQAAFYWQNRDRGYSAPGMITQNEAIEQLGGRLTVPVAARLAVDVKGDRWDAETQDRTAVEADLSYDLSPHWAASVGVRNDDRNTRIPNASEILSEDGGRLDGVLRLDYLPHRRDYSPYDPLLEAHKGGWNAYGFAQATIQRDGNRRDNDRVGLGMGWQYNDRLHLLSEVSGGDGGVGGKIGGDYRIDDRSNAYLTYTLETEREDVNYRGRQGVMTTGSRYRVSDEMAVFGETRATGGAGPQSLIHAYGLDYAPNDRWSYGVKAEVGTVSDPYSGDLDRHAVGANLAYYHDDTKLASALEYRDESGNLLGDRQTWLMRNTFGRQMNASWRLLGKLNFSLSDSDGGEFFDADYAEAVTGMAWRPVSNDRLNALFKYTWFYELPSPGQLAPGSDLIADFAQASHILSVDTIYDLVPWLSLGAKYGLRSGRLKDTRLDGRWFDSRAQLVVLRADFHLVKEWDAVVEGRTLSASEADDRRTGALVGLYRHVGERFKVGVGYNFTDYSDDLTDVSYENRGWFFNIIGEM